MMVTSLILSFLSLCISIIVFTFVINIRKKFNVPQLNVYLQNSPSAGKVGIYFFNEGNGPAIIDQFALYYDPGKDMNTLSEAEIAKVLNVDSLKYKFLDIKKYDIIWPYKRLWFLRIDEESVHDFARIDILKIGFDIRYHSTDNKHYLYRRFPSKD